MPEFKMCCPKCGSPMKFMVQTTVVAPSDCFHNLSKAQYRRSDVQLNGVLWETLDWLCNNSECGNTIDGYGNYVSKLEARVGHLESELKKLSAELAVS